MTVTQALVFANAHKRHKSSMNSEKVTDVIVTVEGDSVRLVAYGESEITLTREDVALIAEMAGARDDAQIAEISALRAELAEAMGDCIDHCLSYGLGDEERYRARYRELTGHGWQEETTAQESQEVAQPTP